MLPDVLNKIGINEKWQLPLIMPFSFSDFRYAFECFPVQQFYSCDKECLFVGKLLTASPEIRLPRTMRKTPFIILELIGDNDSKAKAFIFGTAEELRKKIEYFQAQDCIYLYGLPIVENQQLIIKNPEVIDKNKVGYLHVNYELYQGRKKIGKDVISYVKKAVVDCIPETAKLIREKLSLLQINSTELRTLIGAKSGTTITDHLRNIHAPNSVETAIESINVLEKIAALLVVLESRSVAANWGQKRIPIELVADWEPRKLNIPFKLTDEQISAVNGISELMSMPISQHMMLIGDVGTGKTAVIGLCGARICDAGGYVAILVPSTNLAVQMHCEIDGYFPDLEAQILVDGSKITNEKSKFWIGTTALLHKKWAFNFDLVITDEQQRYSVKQREKLCEFGAHLLESTATPVPRTSALIKHGVINQFLLKKCFVKKELITNLFLKSDRKSLFNKALCMLRNGTKLLIICALKEDSKAESMADIKSAELTYKNWVGFAKKCSQYLPEHTKVVLAHGGRTTEENISAINEMKTGAANILVATTLVETGITIPGLHHIIVLNPERLGLVTHHQLRGRLARHGGTGYYDLYVDHLMSEKTSQRLNVLCLTSDGMKLSIEDMRQRGFGDLSLNSSQQNGVNQKFLFGKQIKIENIERILEYNVC